MKLPAVKFITRPDIFTLIQENDVSPHQDSVLYVCLAHSSYLSVCYVQGYIKFIDCIIIAIIGNILCRLYIFLKKEFSVTMLRTSNHYSGNCDLFCIPNALYISYYASVIAR